MIITAFVLGLAGSLHCLAMCGPLLLWVNRGRSNGARAMYHGARIGTYVVLGMAGGLLGKAIQWTSGPQILSMLAGVLIILSMWFTTRKNSALSPVNWIQQRISSWHSSMGTKSNFVWGALNGLLPCGLTYVAVAAAMAQAQPWQGGVYMLVFGLGTLPALVLLVKGSKFMTTQINLGAKTLKYLTLVIGILLLVRGLGLGVPYLSPSFSAAKSSITICK